MVSFCYLLRSNEVERSFIQSYKEGIAVWRPQPTGHLSVAGHEAGQVASDAGEAGDEGAGEGRLELVHARAVDDARQHELDVELVVTVLGGGELVHLTFVVRGSLLVARRSSPVARVARFQKLVYL